MKGKKGSISVFLIVIIVPIFLFQAVLIEFARSKLAEQQLELAVKAAVRSVGTLYNAPLQAYGLYGVADDEMADRIYREVISSNTGHGFASTEFLTGEIALERSLADPDVFKNQLLEDMKYRAPLEYARQITDKFRNSGISQAMNQFSDYSHKASEMDKLSVKRDEAMKRVWRLFKETNRKLSDSFHDLRAEVKALEPEHSRMQRLDVTSLRSKKKSLESRIRSLRDKSEPSESDLSRLERLEDELDEVEDQLDDYDDWLDRLDDLQDEYRSLYGAVEQRLDSIVELLDEAKAHNDELREQMNDWSSEFGNDLIQSTHLIPDEQFQHASDNATAFQGEFHSLLDRFARLKQGDPDRLAADMQRLYNDWQNWMRDAEAYEAELLARLEQQEEEKREATKQFDEQVKKVLEAVTGCDPDQEETERELYEQLHEIQTALSEEQTIPADDTQYGHGRKAEDDAVSISKMIGDLTARITETIYVNEYAITHFNYRTLGNEKDRYGNARDTDALPLSAPNQRPLVQQEAEYILYGFQSCIANYSAAYWEIFAFRLAIRATESLTEPKNSWRMLGSPMVAFLWALAEGAILAFQDVQKLIDGQEVPISKLAPSFTWNYKDYLRVFFLLHGAKDRYIQRMQALVQLNTQADLSGHYTMWKAEATGSLHSLFLARYTYEPKVDLSWGYY